MHKPIEPIPEILDYVCKNFSLVNGLVERKTGGSVKIDKDGYRYHRVFMHSKVYEYREHHIVWFLSYGVWPTFMIDHKDDDKSNNRIENLQPSTHRLNMAKNKNGGKYPPGVRYRASKGLYEARISVNGKKISIKTSKDMEVCAKAYQEYWEKVANEELDMYDIGKD